MSVYYKILTNAATMRLFAEKMVQSNIEMTEGSPFTMQTWDTWDEEEQRNFLIAFFIHRWDSLSAAAKQAEILNMPQECYRCGVTTPHMTPCAGVGYSALTCSDCALKVLTGEIRPPGHDTMIILVRPHSHWGWDPGEGAPVRFHSLQGRADLNGKTGKLLNFFEANERWGVRVDATSECIKVKSANFTYHAEIKLKLPSDGSTRTRDLVEDVRGKVGTRYVPSQISLWREGVRLEVDAFDAAGVVYSTQLRDHGLGPDDDLRDPSSRTLEMLISPLVKTANGLPQELDPDSEYSKRRTWPSTMAYEEKVRRHVEMFGEDNRYAGPPYHPDVTPVQSFGLPVS